MTNLLFRVLLIAYSLPSAVHAQGFLRGSATSTSSPQHSELWGQNGEKWNTTSPLLRDFTNVGYELSNKAIPDWPIYKYITDPLYGAVPDDDVSDVEAIRKAIDDCPPYMAIGIPDGKYIIDDTIDITKNYIVIRGESRDNTILFFPKHMDEIEGVRTTKMTTPFITFHGGQQRGIENLSLILRDEQKGTGYWRDPALTKQYDVHWYYSGERLIKMGDGETNSWMRNIYVKNSNHAIMIGGRLTRQISIVNVVIDQFINRKTGGDGDGHMGIQIADGATHVLVHNLWITGNWAHDITAMGTRHTVFSRLKGENLRLDHHAMGNQFNLYTDVDTGYGGTGYGEADNNRDETYWGIKGIRQDSYLPTECRSTFVGIYTDEPSSYSESHWHETVDPDNLSPRNIWLAQMAFRGKYVPPETTLTLPPPIPTVRRVLPTDDAHYRQWSPDVKYGYNTAMTISSAAYQAFMKFDLGSLNLGSSQVARASLKIHPSGTSSEGTFGFQLFEADENWEESTLTYSNAPGSGASVPISSCEGCDAFYVNSAELPSWIYLDITEHVNAILGGTDKIMSLRLSEGGANSVGGQATFPSKEGGNPPHLVIHEFADTISPPDNPVGLTAMGGTSSITLTWSPNLEFDLASYNVYRHDGSGVWSRQAMGLTSTSYTDYTVWEGVVYTYYITAVDIAGTESAPSYTVSAVLGQTTTTEAPPQPTTTTEATTQAPPQPTTTSTIATTQAPPSPTTTSTIATTQAPPPPTAPTTQSPPVNNCSTYGMPQPCRAVNGCTWKASMCVPTTKPPDCDRHSDNMSCFAAGCDWRGKKCT